MSIGISGFVAKPAGAHELSEAVLQICQVRGQRTATAAAEESVIKANQHVLVIDDNELVRGSLLSLLKTIGFTPYAAASIPEARRLLETHSVDVVLVDHHLDGENGFEEAPRLFADARAAHGHVPRLIGMTGSEYLPGMSEHQLDAFLTKPFSADQLREVLVGGGSG
jgi:CheY-like chemotaxis protein